MGFKEYSPLYHSLCAHDFLSDMVERKVIFSDFGGQGSEIEDGCSGSPKKKKGVEGITMQ